MAALFDVFSFNN